MDAVNEHPDRGTSASGRVAVVTGPWLVGIASVVLIAGCSLLRPTPESLGVFETLYRSGSADVTVTMGGTDPTRVSLRLVGRAGYGDELYGVSVTWADEAGWGLSIEGTLTDGDVTLRSPDGIIGSGVIGQDCDLDLDPGMPAEFGGTLECRDSGDDAPPGETDHDFSAVFRAGP